MAEDNARVIKSLSQSTAGLLFMSESDYPFEVIQWDSTTELTPNFLRSVTGESKDCPVQEMELEDFLTSGRYQPLLQVLQSQLSSPKAYRVGRINMSVYLVGRSKDGSWLGVSTRVVQT